MHNMRHLDELLILARQHTREDITKIVTIEELIQILNTGYYDNNHPQKSITIKGYTFSVDVNLYDLILKCGIIIFIQNIHVKVAMIILLILLLFPFDLYRNSLKYVPWLKQM